MVNICSDLCYTNWPESEDCFFSSEKSQKQNVRFTANTGIKYLMTPYGLNSIEHLYPLWKLAISWPEWFPIKRVWFDLFRSYNLEKCAFSSNPKRWCDYNRIQIQLIDWIWFDCVLFASAKTFYVEMRFRIEWGSYRLCIYTWECIYILHSIKFHLNILPTAHMGNMRCLLKRMQISISVTE